MGGVKGYPLFWQILASETHELKEFYGIFGGRHSSHSNANGTIHDYMGSQVRDALCSKANLILFQALGWWKIVATSVRMLKKLYID